MNNNDKEILNALIFTGNHLSDSELLRGGEMFKIMFRELKARLKSNKKGVVKNEKSI